MTMPVVQKVNRAVSGCSLIKLSEFGHHPSPYVIYIVNVLQDHARDTVKEEELSLGKALSKCSC